MKNKNIIPRVNKPGLENKVKQSVSGNETKVVSNSKMMTTEKSAFVKSRKVGIGKGKGKGKNK